MPILTNEQRPRQMTVRPVVEGSLETLGQATSHGTRHNAISHRGKTWRTNVLQSKAEKRRILTSGEMQPNRVLGGVSKKDVV